MVIPLTPTDNATPSAWVFSSMTTSLSLRMYNTPMPLWLFFPVCPGYVVVMKTIGIIPYYPHKNRSHSAKPSIPIFHYSNTPWHLILAEPLFSDLAQRTRFSMLE